MWGKVVRLSWVGAPGPLVAMVGLTAVEGLLPPLAAWLTKLLIDELAGGAGASASRVAALAVGVAAAGLLTGLHRSVAHYASGLFSRALRLLTTDRLYQRVNAYVGVARLEDPAFLDRLRLAGQAGAQAPGQLTAAGLALFKGVLQVGGYGAALIAVWPPSVLIVLVAAVPTTVLQIAVSRRQSRLLASLAPSQRHQLALQTLMTDVRAAKEIRLFGFGGFLGERMLADVRDGNAAEAAFERGLLRIEVVLELVSGAVMVAGTAAAAYQAIRGSITVGDVSVFLAALAGVHGSISSITGGCAGVYQALLLFGSYHDIVDTPSERSVAVHDRVGRLRTGVEFRDVWFRYRDDTPWVLRGVTLTIPAGRSIGLVGVNGAGKSTLVKLLCRMYDPQRGQILWDGTDIRDIDPDALRRRITAVFQDFMTYDLTAKENIALGELAQLGDLSAVRTAARAADVDDELAGLPRGYDTLLSRVFAGAADDDVGQLSGGQWQRVALARAFLRSDADLLVLDEPSAGLDAEAEHALHRRLAGLRSGRAGLLISHRLAALRDADEIVVLAGGQVSERGTHAALIGAGGHYARLFALQASGYVTGDLTGAAVVTAEVACDPGVPSIVETAERR
ncbi:ABC transporter ATP-binding protein [Streptosporangiaceae bacterium NEAU-GS5]|nr:ABC transporter ATP-binding protein [Streptosporangiaceae bacterium NEAU-GS5]